MRPNGTSALCVMIGGLALAAPAWTAAQTTLPAETKVDPGSPASGFSPTAYAEATRDFENSVRELDAVQVQMAQVAERKATSPAVQAFAKQIRLAFSGGTPSLKGMSNDQGIPLVGTEKLAREHQTLLAQLQADNADVNRLFVDYEVLVLREVLGVVEPYAVGGIEGRFRKAAADAVSADTILLGAAQNLQKQ